MIGCRPMSYPMFQAVEVRGEQDHHVQVRLQVSDTRKHLVRVTTLCVYMKKVPVDVLFDIRALKAALHRQIFPELGQPDVFIDMVR